MPFFCYLQVVFDRAEAVYGPYDEWFVNDGDDEDKQKKRAFDRITEFMKYSKVCTVNDACTLFDVNNGLSEGNRTPHAIVLPDGATVGFDSWNNEFTIYIDLDGPNKGANAHCKDYFLLGIIPDNFNKQKYIVTYMSRHAVENNEVFPYTTPGCAAWVIVNSNMDYLKGKCPDGEKLQFGVKTSCK